MSGTAEGSSDHEVLVLAPTGQDAEVIVRTLADEGMAATAFPSLQQLCERIRGGAGAAVIADEALVDGGHLELAKCLRAQPEWSDFPLIIMTTRSSELRASRALSQTPALSYAVILERPVHAETLTSAMRSALRSRQRQYQIRDELAHRRRVEDDLRASEEFSRRILTSSLNGLYIYDIQNREMSYISPEYTRLTGYTLDQIRSLSAEQFLELFHPDDRQRILDHAAAAAAMPDGEVRAVEYRFRTASGDWIWCLSREAAFARNPDGSIRQYVGSFIDVTERKQAEDELRRSEATLSAVLDSIPIAVAVADANGRIVRVNDAFNELWGKPLEAESWEKYGKYVAWWPDTGRRIQPEEFAMSRALLKGETATNELIEYQRFDNGEHRFYIDNAAPVRDADGRIIGGVAAMQDVTERRRYEEALRQSEEQLREADRRKNDFLAVLSHELRNPLAPIKNSLYIMEKAAPGGDQAQRARTIASRQVDQLVRLVDDLLDVTRITRNKITLQHEKLNLNDLVRGTVEDYRNNFEKARIQLDFRPSAEAVPVHADWNRVSQMVGNLLQNAVKFTPPDGSVSVSVSREHGEAVVRFSDTGVGMEAETVERLFEPFMQAESTLDRTKGGLGLGLALVKGLAELHGGSVEAASDGLGTGSTFAIRLPLLVNEQVEAAPERPEAERRQRRVLIIEDNIDAAESLREMLQFNDQQVEVAYNGPSGLLKAHEFRPELVICDIGLPGMDGFDVARAFRSHDDLKNIRLVALSGYALPEDLERAKDAGFERHLRKPTTLEELEDLLR